MSSENGQVQDREQWLSDVLEKHVADQTISEVMESLNGFEEIAISERFGASIGKLADVNETLFMRALVFTDMTRAGMTPGEARNAAMRMRLGEVKNWHLPDDDDVMPDDPDSESGKGGSLPVSEPRISLPSASPPE
jgi:hypothetical protein